MITLHLDYFPPPPLPTSFGSPLSASKRAALFRTIVGKRQSLAVRLIVSCRGKRLQALLAEHPDAFHYCGTLRKFNKNKRVKTSCLLQRRTTWIPRDENKRGEWVRTRKRLHLLSSSLYIYKKAMKMLDIGDLSEIRALNLCRRARKRKTNGSHTFHR